MILSELLLFTVNFIKKVNLATIKIYGCFIMSLTCSTTSPYMFLPFMVEKLLLYTELSSTTSHFQSLWDS